jgi:hypothetical protein
MRIPAKKCGATILKVWTKLDTLWNRMTVGLSARLHISDACGDFAILYSKKTKAPTISTINNDYIPQWFRAEFEPTNDNAILPAWNPCQPICKQSIQVRKQSEHLGIRIPRLSRILASHFPLRDRALANDHLHGRVVHHALDADLLTTPHDIAIDILDFRLSSGSYVS